MALTNTVKTQLYQFFAIAFDAAPGVTYMSQLAAAYDSGMSVAQIVEVFTTKPQFLSVYPNFLTNSEFAVKLVNNVVGDSASATAKAEAVADVTAALAAGFTRGKVIYNVFTNLGAKLGDATWGGTAQQMANQVKYAQYFTETLLVDTTDLPTLQAVIAPVTPTSSTTDAAMQAAIGQVLNPTYGLTVSSPTVAEGNSGSKTMTFVLTLSAAPSSDMVVNYTVTGGTATAGEDYPVVAGSVMFAAGQTVATANITVNGDMLAEASETIQLTFTGSRLNASVVATGTISNDDAAPVFNSAATLTVVENIAAAGSLSATDADGNAITYAVAGGADAALFSVNPATGAMTFKAAPDFEAPADAGADNTYNLTVSASDGNGNVTTQAVAVVVTNANDNTPAFSKASAALSVAENATVVGNGSATDADAGTALTYTISGGADASAFSINAATGALSFKSAPNFESGKTAFAVNVTASDGTNSATQALTVNVTDVNEVPAFGLGPVTASVAENSTEVGQALATDPDAGDAITYSLSGTDAAKFNINAATGAVSFKVAPNFEVDAKSYAVTVTATDKAGLSSSQAATISVTDVNEAPAFAAASATVSVSENTKAVANAAAADVDAGDALTYTLSGADAAVFSINASTGALSFKNAPNFEVDAKSYNVTVTATDKAGLSAAQAVTVNVTDVNEAPTFAAATATVSVNENSTAVGNSAATDVDAGSVLTYSVAGTDAAKFNINASTGALSFKTAPNYEVDAKSYSVSVTATDAGGLAATQAVTVNVADLFDETPVGKADAVTTNDNTSVLISVLANDSDADVTDVLAVKSVTQSANGGLVEIVGTQVKYTPNVKFLNGVDTFTYTAVDKGGNVSTPTTVTVTVNTFNDPPMVDTGANQPTLTVAENTAAGASVGFATAKDQEGNAVLNWKITGGTGQNLFSINNFTGEITSKAAFDFEATPSYTLDLTAQDSAGLTSSVGTVTVKVTNVNEAVTVSSGATGTIAENAATSTVAYTVTSTDVDAGDTATYSLKAGGDAASFNIDSKTGAVTLKASANFEAKASYAITVVATDAGGLTSEKAVTINVTDVNEAPTVNSAGTASVAENAAVATVVYTAAASDVDAGDSLTYTLAGADAAAFNIDGKTGAVTLKASADFETKSAYAIDVVATDKGGLSASKAVAVSVTDVNEAPTFASAAAKAADIAENGNAGATVYTAAASDVDAGDKITYSLGGADAAAFTVDATTGAVTINAAANFEAQKSYAFDVIATDKGGKAATQAVTLAVTDVNEAPTITSAAASAIDENAAVATVAYTVTSTDVDTGDAATYSLKASVGDASMLSINAATGAVTLNASANFEVKNSYSFTVVTTDKGGLTAEKAVTVSVNDKNDAPVAKADSTTVLTGVLKTIDVLANDTDEDAGDTKTIDSVTQPTKGGVVVINNGKVDYTSAVGYVGDDTFTYTMKDKAGVTSTATVTVGVSSNTGGTSGDDTLYGTTAAENIDGAAGNDTIVGGGGADTLIGNEGNDRITYRDSAAQILGGNGTDTLVIDASAVAAKFDLSSATNQVTDGNKGSIVVRGMENVDASTASNAITIDAVSSGTTSLVLGSQADTVTTMAAATGNVTVTAGGGNDSVTAGAMAATATLNIDGGDGNDTIDTSATADAKATVTGGAGNDAITTDGEADSIDGGAGDDTITAGGGADTVAGGEGADSIVAGEGANSVTAGAGNDTVTAGAGNDTLSGGDGADSITAGEGANSVDGGIGNDTLSAGSGNDTILAGDGDDSVVGGEGANSIAAGAGADTITAGAGNDTVDAGDGNDAITAGAGANSITAGAGNDTITVTTVVALKANALVSGGADTDTVVFSTDTQTLVDADLAAVSGIEALKFANGNNSVTLAANANTAGLATVTTGTGNDTINTSAAGYTLNAVINAGAGDDAVTTGSGNDSVTVGAGNDNVVLGAGNDTLVGAANISDADTLTGGDGTDVLQLNAGSTAGAEGAQNGKDATSTISFDGDFTGFETITLAAGADSVNSSTNLKDQAGALNNYVITLGDATNVAASKVLTVDGSALRTGVITGIGDTTADTDGDRNIGEADTTGSETLTLTATAIAGSVSVLGGAGADTITGSAQADTITGNGGADVITGGGGADSIDGGAGADSMRFATTAALTAAATVIGGADSDTVAMTTDGQTLTDAAFAKVSGVESFSTANGANSVTLGTNAEAAGIRTASGGTGSDTISVAAYASNGATVNGGDGTDSITGSAQADSLAGGDGADTLIGGAGNDTIVGGAGADSIVAGDGDEVITTEGNDIVDAGNGNDSVTLGSAAADVSVTLGDGNDTVSGGATVTDADTLTGGAGTDVLQLNAGSTAGAEGAQNGVDATTTITFDGDFTGFESITLAAGAASVDSSTNLKDRAGALNNYVITLGAAANVAASTTLTVDGSALRAGVITGIGDGTDTDGDRNIGEADSTGSETMTLTATAISGSVSVLGGAGNDTITTSAQADTIVSGAGNDVITSNAGNDSISAGEGSDTVTSGDGADTIDAGAGNDSIIAGAGADSVIGGAGNDTIEGGDGNDNLSGGEGDDSFVMTRAQLGNDVDTVDGGAGSNGITVSTSADTTVDDVFFAVRFSNIQAITLNGTAGGATEVYTYTAGTYSQGAGIRSITVGSDAAGNVSVSQYTVATTLTGGTGNDTFTGSALADSISGGAGTDSITAGDGNDTIAGGAGVDTVDAGAGDDIITTEGADVITAGAGNDSVTLGSAAADVSVTLGDGNDTVSGGATVTDADTLTGGAGTDVLQLNAGSTAGAEGAQNGVDATTTITFDGDFTGFESITLAAGADFFNSSTNLKDRAGALNNYVITLGAAANVAASTTLTVDGSALRAGVITGIGDGTDTDGDRNIGEADSTGSETMTLTATAISGSVSVLGGAGNDTITTSAQADTIVSGAGNDVITSNAGNDSISAGDGTDNINAGEGDNTVDGGAGNDTIASGSGNDVITTGTGDHTVTSGEGNDSITANTGNDSITAGDGNDTIVAGDGNDTVAGGNGVDVIDLGGGSDVLVYTAVANSTGTNFDDVSNFTSGTDRLLITVVDPDAQVGNAQTLDLSGFAVVGSFADGLVSLSGNSTGAAPTNRVYSDGFYSTAEGKLYIDSNGDGQINQNTDMIIKIGSVAAADVGFTVNTGAGADTMTGGAGADSFAGGAAADVLSGGGGNDTLLGEAAADSLSGGAGNDSIVGGAAGDADADTITGGAGADTLTGGGGSDLFFIATVGDSGITLATADRITDFATGADVLRLGLAGTGDNYSEAGAAVADFAAALTAANTALAALNAGAGGGDAHLYNFQFDATNGYLFIDRDSNGTADEVVVLVGVNNTGIGSGDIGGP